MSKKKKNQNPIIEEEDDVIYEDYDDEDYDVGYHEEVKIDFEKVKKSYLGMEDWTGGIPVSKVNEVLRKQRNEKEHDRVMGVFHTVLYILCFAGIILCSAEYGSFRFQTMEFYYARLALMFFFGILWGLQRVKLFRWQSLVLTVLYAPYAYFYWYNEALAEDIALAVISELIVRWMVMMLITDLAVKKNPRPNNKFIPWAFALLCVMTAFTLMNRNGSMVPVSYMYFIMMCFIPLDGKDWDRIQECMFYGTAIGFVAITIFTFTGDPFAMEPRDYYMITDDLGQVFGLTMAVSCFGLIYFAEKYGRISASYFLSAFCLIASVVMAVYKGTDGILIGVVFLAFTFFVFGIGKKKAPHIFIRLGIALALIAAAVVAVIILANKIIQPEFDTAAFSNTVMSSPLQYLPETAEELIGKVESAHSGSGAYGGFIKPRTIGAVMNVFLDTRVAMFFEAVSGIGWDGHPINGSDAGAFILAAKVQYLQYLFQFGYFAGGLNLVFFIALWITSIVKYLKTKKMWYLLPMLIFAMVLGAWFNVSSGLFYSLVFFGMLSLYPHWVDLGTGKKKKKKEKRAAENEKPADTDEGTAVKEDLTEEKNTNDGTMSDKGAGTSVNGEEKASAEEKTDSSEDVTGGEVAGKEEEKAEAETENEDKTETKAEAEEQPAESEVYFDDSEEEAEAEPVGFVPLSTAEIRIDDPQPITGPQKKSKHFTVEEGRPIDRNALEDVAIMDFEPIEYDEPDEDEIAEEKPDKEIEKPKRKRRPEEGEDRPRKRRPEADEDRPKKRRPEEGEDRPRKRRPEAEEDRPGKRRPETDGDRPRKRRPETDGDRPRKRRPEADGDRPRKRRPEAEEDRLRRKHDEE